MSQVRVDRLLAIVVVSTAVVVGWASAQIDYSFSSDPLGPRAFPAILCGIIALCGIWLAIAPSGQRFTIRLSETRPIAVAGISILSALLFPVVGFVPAVFLLCTATSRAFGARWLAAVIVGLCNSCALWVVFTSIFGIYLPPMPFWGG